MNSIRRPRARPRVRSVSFRTFAWLLVREGYCRIIFRCAGNELDPVYKPEVMHSQPWHLHRHAQRILARYPNRREYP
jgi:hypothetical protein